MTLQDLLVKVEAAEGGSRELERDIALHVAGWTFEKRGSERKAWWRAPGQTWANTYNNSPPSYTTSLDAAVALVEAKLPGWDYLVCRTSGECSAEVGPPDTFQQIGAKAASPALALLAALLKALIAQEQPK